MINSQEIQRPEKAILPRQLITDLNDLVYSDDDVSLTVSLINGHWGNEDILFLSKSVPMSEDGRKITWLPAHLARTTVRSNLNTARTYTVWGQLAKARTE